ncbi:MAG: hypothetical protein ACJ74H_05935 [Thermoanaerobaculia bacterium]
MATSAKRPGLPNPKSVVMEIPFAPAGVLSMAEVSPAAPKYRILRTTEVDQYETPPSKLEVAQSLAPESMALGAAKKKAKKKKGTTKAAGSDLFKGTSRKASKLSISDAKTEKFADLADMIATLVPDKTMRTKGITKDATSKRVPEEDRNVRVDCYIYAASREDDNDFHLILGRDPDAGGKEVYLTMELSGLPPANAKSRAALEKVRDTFKAFFAKHFAGNLPGTSYDFYDPPIHVDVEGSLFWDASHGGAKDSHPGPQSLRSKIPNVWEVHPISKIKLIAP